MKTQCLVPIRRAEANISVSVGDAVFT
jgi:hypothetical protein